MERVLKRLGEREVGEKLSMSIPTALAIESACGIHPEIVVDYAPILDVQAIWINLRTLVRNLTSSVESDVRDMIMPDHAVTVLLEEMTIIESAISRASGGKTVVVFYHCTYNSMRRRFPKANLKHPRTALQLAYAALEKGTVKGIMDSNHPHDIRTFDIDIRAKGPESFLLTHRPVDLLSRYEFDKLALLESHTGAIKKPAQWNTKLTGGKEMPRMPFNRMTLQVFGDGGEQFSPLPHGVKKAVEGLAESERWTPVTTNTKVISDIGKLKDRALAATLKAMF